MLFYIDRYKKFYTETKKKKSRNYSYFTDALGGRLPVKFVLKDHRTSVPEDTPPGSVLLTAGVNKVDPVGSKKFCGGMQINHDYI